jgi:copper transport protein
VWLVVTVVILLGLGAVPTVSAHANLVEATPGNGDQVAEPPDEITLQYSEGVQLATVTVTDEDGERIDSDTAYVDDENPTIVHVPLEAVDNGTYTVNWQVLSVDGHTTRGSFFFVVGDELPDREQLLASLSGDEDPGYGDLDPVEPAARWLLFVSLGLVIGLPVTLAFVVDPALRDVDGQTHRIRRLLLGASILVAIGVTMFVTVRMLSALPSLSGDQLAQFGRTEVGRVSAVQMLLAVGLLAISALPFTGRVRVSDRRWLGALVLGGAALGLTLSWISHSAAVIDGMTGVLIDWTHLLGAAAWIGGLAALVLVLPTLGARTETAVSPVVARLIRRFSVVALAGVGLSAATGLLIASWHVPTAESLVGTRYGTLLTAKVVLVAVAVGLGAVNRFAIHPILSEEPDRNMVGAVPGALLLTLPDRETLVKWFLWSVRIELALLLVVLALTGVLTSIPTAADASQTSHASHDEPVPLTVFGEAGNTELRVEIIPVRVGLNVVDVHFLENGTSVQADEEVALLLRHPETNTELPQTTLEPSDGGRYSAVVAFPTGGQWEVRVSTWIDGQFAADRFTVNVPPASTGDGGHGDHGEQTGSPDGQFPSLLRFGALGIAIASVLVVAYEGWRLRRSRNE